MSDTAEVKSEARSVQGSPPASLNTSIAPSKSSTMEVERDPKKTVVLHNLQGSRKLTRSFSEEAPRKQPPRRRGKLSWCDSAQELNEHNAHLNFVTKSLTKYISALDSDGTGKVKVKAFLMKLKDCGLHVGDCRLKAMFEALYENPMESIPIDTLTQIAALGGVAVYSALSGRMVIPNFKSFAAECEKIYEEVKLIGSGEVADYIPQLKEADPNLFAVSITTVDGQQVSFGDKSKQFCLQSISKPITYCEAMNEHGVEMVHKHVGREPSGVAFNAMALLETKKHKHFKKDDKSDEPMAIPHNPLINAGAIICSSMMNPGCPLSERLSAYIKIWSKCCGEDVGFDPTVMMSERATADRNMALAYMLKENHAFATKNVNVNEELELYFSTCSVTANASMLATAGATLANGGKNPRTGERVFDLDSCRNVLSLMLSCGMYNYSGEWAFTVGLPAKSGVSGGLLVVIPNVLGLAIYSPPLDTHGNTVRGIAFAQRLVEKFAFHHLDFRRHQKAMDPTVKPQNRKQEQMFRLNFAAASGDLLVIRQLMDEYHIDVNVADYDKRTALHIAASEGQLEVVKYLLDNNADMNLTDRWGNTAQDDAKREKHDDVAELLASIQI